MAKYNKIYMTGANGMLGRRLRSFLDVTPISQEILYGPDLADFVTDADLIIHMGAYGNMSWQNDEAEMFRANTLATFSLLEACKRNSTSGFIFIGSSSEYGNKTEPMNEEMKLEPITMYATTKVCGSYLTKYYSKYFETAVVRPFSVYGEEEDARRFIPTIIQKLATGEEMTLFEGKHDWIYINDFCQAVIKITKNLSRVHGDAFNVGTGTETTNSKVVEILEKISGKKLRHTWNAAKTSDSYHWVADNQRIMDFGWKPETSLEEGLKKVYDYKIAPRQ